MPRRWKVTILLFVPSDEDGGMGIYMKKKTAFILIAVLTLGLFAGCGGAASESKSSEEIAAEAASSQEMTSESAAAEDAAAEDAATGSAAAEESGSPKSTAGGEVDLDSLKTLGDAFALQGKDEDINQRGFSEDKYIYVFSIAGVPYRVTADLPADVSEKLFALEFDENYEKNEMELVSGLEITSRENLNDQILPQEELDALVGKTGQELFDAGWREGSFYNTETLEVSLEYGPFSYKMQFDGEVPPEDAEDFDVYTGLADKKVLDVAFEGLGDATYMEEEESV